MGDTENTTFARAMARICAEANATVVVETGTYTGQGSTRMFASLVAGSGGHVHSIECNPNLLALAQSNLRDVSHVVTLHAGLSIPVSKLPTSDDIRRICGEARECLCYIDHPPGLRVMGYTKETSYFDPTSMQDDLLVKLVTQHAPDIIYLDSAGHMGFVEFTHLLESGCVTKKCIIALDDVYHVKHFKSRRAAEVDNRFQLIENSSERFGWAIYAFDSTAAADR